MTVTTLPVTSPLVAALPVPPFRGSDWRAAAACQGLDTEAFFLPENARGRNKRTIEAAAKAVCTSCPVVTQCLKWAIEVEEPYGVWGGTTPEERAEFTAAGAPFDVAV